MPLDTKIGNPAPLGLVGFGLTTVMLSFVNAGLLPADGATVVIPLAMAYGGTIQLFAGWLSFREGNTFGLVAFSSYGAFWWWFGLYEIFAGNGLIAGNQKTFGVALIMWGIFTFYMWIGTFQLNWGLWSVFLTLWITYVLLGLGEIYGGSLGTWGGYIGILTGALAMYVSFAEVANWSFARTVLPLGDAPMSGRGTDSGTDTAD